MKSYKKSLLFILCVLICTIFMGCSSEPLTKTNFLLGTIIDIKLFDHKDTNTIDLVFDKIADIEKKMTINNAKESEIININESAGSDWVKVSKESFFVIQRAKNYCDLSNGRFDITVGPIVKLWNIGTEKASIPPIEKIEASKSLVDYKKILLNENSLSVKLQKEDMIIDLGAIAKGYAADEAARILRENGVKSAIINLGGNVYTVGKNPKGEPWKIGIQDPNDQRGSYIGIVKLSDASLVSSGTYERYFEKDGVRYHHIIDPKTGFPVQNNLASVSIKAKNSIDADALSTTVFLLGLEEGMKLVEKLDDVEAIIITKDKKIYLSSGIKNDFELSNNTYTMINPQ